VRCSGSGDTRGLPAPRFRIRETLTEGATRIAEDASIRRTGLLMQPNCDALAMGVDAADSIGAGNSLEKMLAHQSAVAYEASLCLMDRALGERDSVETCRLTCDGRKRRPRQPGGLHLRLLGDLQSVIDLDAEISDGAFEVMDRSPKRDPCHRFALESPFRHGILHAQDRWRRVLS